MTKLLVAASALAVGLSLSGMAYAGGPGGPGNNQGGNSTDVAVAASVQGGSVFGNASGTAAFVDLNSLAPENKIEDRSFDHAEGLFNVQQNTGANSLQQSANTLGAILDCSCSDNGTDATLALNAQVGTVGFNRSGTLAGFALTSASNRIEDSAFDHATGLFNVSQNTGANSLQQASNTVAAIVGTGH